MQAVAHRCIQKIGRQRQAETVRDSQRQAESSRDREADRDTNRDAER